jgi:hypothetical protein
LTGSHPEIDAIKPNYRPLLLSLSLTAVKRGREKFQMMDRLRSPLQTLGGTAFLICALSLAGIGSSHAGPSSSSESVDVSGEPCNDVCKAYMAWSHRVSAMFGPSQPLEKHAAHHGKPPRTMVRYGTRQPALSSFARLPEQSDAMPESAETRQAAQTPQAEVAPSPPIDRIADRFPAAGNLMTAKRAGTDSATNDAAESTVVAVADTIPATQATGTIDGSAVGVHMRQAAVLLLGLCALTALVFWRRFRGRHDADRDALLMSDRTVARARRMG